jgi:hypothetical protein
MSVCVCVCASANFCRRGCCAALCGSVAGPQMFASATDVKVAKAVSGRGDHRRDPRGTARRASNARARRGSASAFSEPDSTRDSRVGGDSEAGSRLDDNDDNDDSHGGRQRDVAPSPATESSQHADDRDVATSDDVEASAVYYGFRGDLSRCELVIAMFVFARVMLPLVVRAALATAVCARRSRRRPGVVRVGVSTRPCRRWRRAGHGAVGRRSVLQGPHARPREDQHRGARLCAVSVAA